MIAGALRKTHSRSADIVESQQGAELTVRDLQYPSASLRNILHLAENRPLSAARQKGDDAVSEAVWRKSVSESPHGSDPQYDEAIGPMRETARSDECKACNTSPESVHAGTSVSPATTGQYGKPSLWNARSHNALQTSSLFAHASSFSPVYRRVGKAFYKAINLGDWEREIESEINEVDTSSENLPTIPKSQRRTPQPYRIIRMQNIPSEEHKNVKQQTPTYQNPSNPTPTLEKPPFHQ